MKKSISFIGTCIANELMRQLKLKSVFDLKHRYFNVLPWNFFEPLEIPEEFLKKVEEYSSGLQKEVWSVIELGQKALDVSDYILIDLYALNKPIIPISFDKNMQSSTKIVYGVYQEVSMLDMYHGKILACDKIDENYIYQSLDKLVDLLCSVYRPEQVIVIRPKTARRFLNEDMQLEYLDQMTLLKRQKTERSTLMYTDYLIHKMGACKILDVPNDVTEDHRGAGAVHYIQHDYLRMADMLLDELDIDYSEYWKSELDPVALQFEYWARNSDMFYQLARLMQSEILGINIEDYRTSWALPARVNMKIKYTKLFDVEVIQRILVKNKEQNRRIAYFGAGSRCKEILQCVDASNVDAIIDNDERKAGSQIAGIDVICAKDITDWTKYLIIVTCMDSADIEEQLQDLGLKKDIDYILAKDYPKIVFPE